MTAGQDRGKLRLCRGVEFQAFHVRQSPADGFDPVQRQSRFVDFGNSVFQITALHDQLARSLGPDLNDIGRGIMPGQRLEDFFKERPNLQHEMVEEPWQLGDATIEYRFEKTWDGGSWNSYDIEEQRDKVERLVFEGGKLKRVSVEEVGRGGEDVLEDDFAASLLRKPGDNPDDPPEPKPAKKKPSKKSS